MMQRNPYPYPARRTRAMTRQQYAKARKRAELREDALERMVCATKQVQDGRLDVSALLYEIGQFVRYRSRVC